MKKIAILTILACVAAVSPALPTYYGLSGLTFLPGARIGGPGSVGLGFRSTPAEARDMTIHPLSFSASFTVLPYLELGLTNTYQYYLQTDLLFLGLPVRGGGFAADRSNLIVPFLPSAKFSFIDAAVPNGAIAVGFQYPLGAFFCFDYSIPLGAGYGLYLVFGFGTTLETLNPFMGARAELPLGIQVMLEAGYSGMTARLTSSQEIFGAATAAYRIAKGVDVDFTFRLDQDGIRRAMLGYAVEL
jgi:hypothetical protein